MSNKYKPLREMTKEQKAIKKWMDRGCPRIFWDSSKRGTYRRPKK